MQHLQVETRKRVICLRRYEIIGSKSNKAPKTQFFYRSTWIRNSLEQIIKKIKFDGIKNADINSMRQDNCFNILLQEEEYNL